MLHSFIFKSSIHTYTVTVPIKRSGTYVSKLTSRSFAQNALTPVEDIAVKYKLS
jgi:hypothetical protein